MPKCGMFKRSKEYIPIEWDLSGKAFSVLYALHEHLKKKEAKVKRAKEKRKHATV